MFCCPKLTPITRFSFIIRLNLHRHWRIVEDYYQTLDGIDISHGKGLRSIQSIGNLSCGVRSKRI